VNPPNRTSIRSSPVISAGPAVVVTLYILLWGFEGAVRKWVPGLDSTFYVARDAFILVALLAVALLSSRARRQPYLVWIFMLVMLVVACTSVIGGNPLAVGVIGIRSYVAPLLLVGFISLVDKRNLVVAAVRAVCVVAVVNLPLTIAQVLSSPAAVINKQVGDGTAYFVNPGDVVRASGTFSSPLGHTQMLPLALAASLVALNSKVVSKSVALPTLFAVAVMTILSGSRGAVVSDVIVIVAYLYIMVALGTFRSLGVAVAFTTVIAGVVAATASFFPTVVDSFLLRVDQASKAEDVSGRVLGSTFDFLTMQFTIMGSGPGAASTAAQNLGIGLAVENDMPRWVTELGVLGFVLAIARLCIGVWLVWIILRGPRKSSMLSLPFAAVLAPVMLTGVITLTPSSQGAFAIALAMFILGRGSGPADSPPARLTRRVPVHADARHEPTGSAT